MKKTSQKMKLKGVDDSVADYDYITKLSKAERDWLEKFSQEYYNGAKLDGTIHTDRSQLPSQHKRRSDVYGSKSRSISYDEHIKEYTNN